MVQDSRFDRYKVIVNCAVIGAHANFIETGFRHRDVRFLMELFSNWIDIGIGAPVLKVQNTQVSRYLDMLAKAGYARRTIRKKYPFYRLTRSGLFELLNQLVSRHYWNEREQFFLLFSFIENYRDKLEEVIAGEGSLFSAALQIELRELLNAEKLLNRELEAAKIELKKLDQTVRDVEKGLELTLRLLKSGVPFEQVFKEMEKKHPYGLNNQKPLSELMAELPVGLKEWEMVEGQRRRQRQMFRPLKAMLETYVKELERLRSS